MRQFMRIQRDSSYKRSAVISNVILNWIIVCSVCTSDEHCTLQLGL